MATAHGTTSFTPKQVNLTVNLTKSEFGHAHITFLEHIVDQGQVSLVIAKVEAVASFPTPQNKKELMHFLGMAGYYRKFYQNFLIVTAPLTKLLRKQVKYHISGHQPVRRLLSE